MTRRRFIADQWNREDARAEVTGAQAIHLARVLRAERGEIFDIVAGGFLHRAEITAVDLASGKECVAFTLHEELEADTSLPLHLILAIFKFDRLEWAIEKATELGVDRISPVIARRTETHLAHAAEKRVDRWRRIVHEAAKQSRRSSVPTIEGPQTIKAALAPVVGARILLSEVEQASSFADQIRAQAQESEITIAIGPEGGWAPDEMKLFASAGWTAATLGRRILRAETAAIAAIAIAGAELTRLQPK